MKNRLSRSVETSSEMFCAVDAPASDLDGVLVDVGAEDLDVSARRLVLQELK